MTLTPLDVGLSHCNRTVNGGYCVWCQLNTKMVELDIHWRLKQRIQPRVGRDVDVRLYVAVRDQVAAE
jgi:hypothetical protein